MLDCVVLVAAILFICIMLTTIEYEAKKKRCCADYETPERPILPKNTKLKEIEMERYKLIIDSCKNAHILDNAENKIATLCETKRPDLGFAILKQMIEKANKAVEYEDLEEQGLLIKLPCKVGDMVYLLGGKDYNEFHVGCIDWKCRMKYKGNCYQLYLEDSYCDKAYRNFSDIGKTVFLTQEEAENALEGKDNENYNEVN